MWRELSVTIKLILRHFVADWAEGPVFETLRDEWQTSMSRFAIFTRVKKSKFFILSQLESNPQSSDLL